ncbi:SCP2 domain-containing protein [Psychromonas sp. psych-6C06]|uniref:ubiquinone anaerobic biosynthesis accessory factor UbiT n=1 Tax=Psychromonas sp. psych-6C06 TaxID=2058089 RepID=UPI000C3202DB|nr:SCP2 sterol-binding domain-containing protein [Psychromonas sp. psych-6C06]PKF61012.1 SCP2 domain-containing protein [Psychromonas sp. psych-6C06]
MFNPLLKNIHHQLVKNAPNVLALPSSLMPFFIQKKLLGELLARLFKEAIEDGDLEFLQDKWLKVEVTDLKLTWFLSFKDEKLVINESAEQVDVIFSGDVNELILIAGRKEDPDTLFFQRRLTIQGDTELGLEVKNLLDNIDFETLPDLAQQSIQRFSNFVQQGMKPPQTVQA